MAAAANLQIIDSHLHIWQRSRFAYHWLEAGSALDRDFRLEDIRREMTALNVVGGLLMEATNTPQEIPWLLAICEADPCALGVIGWIPLEAAAACEQIHHWARHAHFKGVRLNWLSPRHDTEGLAAAMQALQENALVVDILPSEAFLPEIATFMRRYPGITFVLEHFGGVAIDKDNLPVWQQTLTQFAGLPNIVIKLSGFSAHSAPLLSDYLHTATETIGVKRLMFGSNWPICLRTATYTDTISTLQSVCATLETQARNALFYDTAIATYKLAPRKETASHA